MLGRVTVNDPVWMPSVASKWLPWSPFIERITHRSSAHSAMFGNRSLISVPLLPCGLNVQFGGLTNCLSLSGFPASAISLGLGSNESTCDTPPLMYRKMTRLALGTNCAGRGASGSATPPVESVDATASAIDISDRIAGRMIDPPISDRSIVRRDGQPQLASWRFVMCSPTWHGRLARVDGAPNTGGSPVPQLLIDEEELVAAEQCTHVRGRRELVRGGFGGRAGGRGRGELRLVVAEVPLAQRDFLVGRRAG